ncbi:MAG TPA: hypothetical protein VF595_07135 [Tepidisphaeraceae bacterium]
MKSDPRDYKIEISSLPSNDSKAASPSARPFLSVLFNCCGVYQRVYKTPAGQEYSGRCPKCLRTVRFVVGPGGTSGRSFVVE